MVSAWGWVLLGATVAGWLVLLVAWKALCVAGAQADVDAEQMCAKQVTDKGAGLMDETTTEQLIVERLENSENVPPLMVGALLNILRNERTARQQAQTALHALAQPCRWTEDLEGYWLTGCQRAYYLQAGTPTDNSFDCCPGCGHPLVWQVNAAVDAAALKLLAWPADDSLVVPV